MSIEPSPVPSESPPPPRRPWRAKFDDAFRGVKLGIRGHSSFFVHFFVAAVVIAAAAVLRVGAADWCILIGCITAVFVAELLNSTIEELCRTVEIERLPNGKRPLDIAAGAVLVAAIGAAVIGGIVLGTRLVEMIR